MFGIRKPGRNSPFRNIYRGRGQYVPPIIWEYWLTITIIDLFRFSANHWKFHSLFGYTFFNFLLHDLVRLDSSLLLDVIRMILIIHSCRYELFVYQANTGSPARKIRARWKTLACLLSEGWISELFLQLVLSLQTSLS